MDFRNDLQWRGMKDCRIGGPRVGVGPSLLASPPLVYSRSLGLKTFHLAFAGGRRYSLRPGQLFFQYWVLLTDHRETLVFWTSHQPRLAAPPRGNRGSES